MRAVAVKEEKKTPKSTKKFGCVCVLKAVLNNVVKNNKTFLKKRNKERNMLNLSLYLNLRP